MARSKKDNRNRKSGKGNRRMNDRRDQRSDYRAERDSRGSGDRESCDRSDIRDKRYTAVNGANDISWYTRYPDLLQAAAQFPYPYRPGMDLPLSKEINGYPTFRIPGVMSILWAPSVGLSLTNQDPASVVGKQIYSQVRKVYSGALEADAPDFVIYLMALDSIFSYLGWLKRVYRCITAYSPNNYALPDTLLHAMGFSDTQISYLRQNKVLFFENINTLIYQSRKFTCPAVMDVMNRHYWLSDNVYTDANSINSQIYMFNPEAFLAFGIYDTPDKVQAGGLGYWSLASAIGTGNNVVASLYQFGDQMIQTLVDWDEAYTISGYLQRAYDGVSQFAVDLLRGDEYLTPVYNEEVLTQIENSRGLPFYSKWSANFPTLDATVGVVTQDPTTNTVLSDMNYVYSYTGYTLDEVNAVGRLAPMLTIRSDSPTIADNVIATRLLTTASIGVKHPSSTTTIDVSCGTEMLLGYHLYDAPDSNGKQYSAAYTIEPTSSMVDVVAILNAGAKCQQFDWNPGIVVLYAPSVEGNFEYAHVMKDIHNVTVITTDDLENLHRVCLYSEFNAFNF